MFFLFIYLFIYFFEIDSRIKIPPIHNIHARARLEKEFAKNKTRGTSYVMNDPTQIFFAIDILLEFEFKVNFLNFVQINRLAFFL